MPYACAVQSDQDLLERWQQGDTASGEALYRRWVGHVTRFFRNKVSDDAEVPDLVSASFVALTQAKDALHADPSFRSLLFAVARRTLASHLRKRYKRVREAEDFGVLCIAEITPMGPSSLMVRERGRRAFLDSLRKLSLDDQTLLELRYFEGLTGPELAEVQGVPEGTIRGRIARATTRLTQAVQEALGGEVGRGDAPAVDHESLERWAAGVRVLLGRDADG